MLDVTQALYWLLPELNAQAGKQEPSPVVEGMLVYADGTSWNPGAGKGVYRRDGAMWRKLSGPSVQSVVTGSRAINGTVYQNTTGGTMWVKLTAFGSASTFLEAFSDSNTSPTTKVGRRQETSSTYSLQLVFEVLAGNYYKVLPISGSWTLELWVETY